MWITAVLAGVTLPLAAQYPGQVANSGKNTPTLRAVAVFEWTGDEAKPKASRLVPVCVYDGQELQDADDYLARPAPIALYSDVEYQLFKDGKPVGLFDVDRAGQQQGSWIGFGKWKPMPRAKPTSTQVAKIDADNDAQSDAPTLHRKHHGGDASSGTGGASGGSTNGTGNGPGNGSGNGSGPDPSAPPPDPVKLAEARALSQPGLSKDQEETIKADFKAQPRDSVETGNQASLANEILAEKEQNLGELETPESTASREAIGLRSGGKCPREDGRRRDGGERIPGGQLGQCQRPRLDQTAPRPGAEACGECE